MKHFNVQNGLILAVQLAFLLAFFAALAAGPDAPIRATTYAEVSR
jgi:hypothetical protein